MMRQEDSERLSVLLGQLTELCEGPSVTFGELLGRLHLKGHMLVCVFFAAPCLLPVPLPGLSTVFGFVIGLAALQIMFGRDPWVPQSWQQRVISGAILAKIFDLLERLIKRGERFIRPRIKFLSEHPLMVRVNGLVLFLVAGLLSLPMPPGFNAPPAIAIILLALGCLERDGVLVLVGYLAS